MNDKLRKVMQNVKKNNILMAEPSLLTRKLSKKGLFVYNNRGLHESIVVTPKLRKELKKRGFIR